MSFAKLLKLKTPPKPEPEVVKPQRLTPFDFVDSIHFTKKPLIYDEATEKAYNPYIVNRALSFGADTIIYANEMNSRPHLDKFLQFSFLLNIIRAKKRFNRWEKAEKSDDLEAVKQYYGYSTDKAKAALRLLAPEQLDIIKEQLYTGGQHDKRPLSHSD